MITVPVDLMLPLALACELLAGLIIGFLIFYRP